ncbi:MAG TPA: SDR family oxidoreductase [Methylomirabilota bacterium]|nr:SDR family oxidoreductase [Methylomirabilota bacterium]
MPSSPVPDEAAPIRLTGWALVLGASSGFGAAASAALAGAGLDVFGVHLDRKASLPLAEAAAAAVQARGRRARFFNVNAADPERRAATVAEMAQTLAADGRPGSLRVLLHSLAFGTLRPFVTEPISEAVSPAQMDMTVDVMAHTLVYWTQAVVAGGLMGAGGRVFAMTSAGGTRVLPSYGPVSAAKAALESHVRQLAVELAPRGITVNALRAGVTATPAAQKIPGYEALAEAARRRNPSGRLTAPDDVARALVVLSHPDAAWITGNVIGVDGGEDVVG